MRIHSLILFLIIGTTTFCTHKKHNVVITEDVNDQTQWSNAETVLKDHLNALQNKDINSLKNTLSPTGDFQNIVMDQPISISTNEYLDLLQERFQKKSWQLNWEILNMQVGEKIALATAQIAYTEQSKKGKPLTSKWAMGYGLRNENGKWYIIKSQMTPLP